MNWKTRECVGQKMPRTENARDRKRFMEHINNIKIVLWNIDAPAMKEYN